MYQKCPRSKVVDTFAVSFDYGFDLNWEKNCVTKSKFIKKSVRSKFVVSVGYFWSSFYITV
jgi:hypothetical protein